MSDNVGRIFGILAALGVLWIVVYWWWEPAAPRISFDTSSAVERVSAPLPREPVPEASWREPARAAPPARATPPEAGPAADPAPPRIAVIPPRFKEYKIKRGDTLESISRAEWGTSRYAGSIREANALADLERLKPGRVIRIPEDPTNIQGKPVEGAAGPTVAAAEVPAAEYTVKPGDTLSEVAKAHYGSTRFATFIYEANKDRLSSEDAVRVGQKLRLPAKPR
jgi:nucleoid-associated protein YgaU